MDQDEFVEEYNEEKDKTVTLLELLSVQMLHISTVLTFLLEYSKDVPKEVKALTKANLREVIEDFKEKTDYVTLFGLNDFVKEYLA